MLNRLSALIRKEALQIFRDPSSILIAVVLPFLLLFLYGYGVSLDLDHLRIGVCLEDTGPDARNFLQSMQDSRYFDITVDRDREPLYAKLEEGSIRGIVVVPSYFSQFLQDPHLQAPIQVIADGSETNTANFVQYYVQGAFQNWLSQEAFQNQSTNTSLIHIEPRFWYNEELQSRFFLLSGSLAIIMTLIGSLLTALVVAREWERGTMEALLSTEVRTSELILGKMIPYFLLGMVSMTICALVSVFYYGLPMQGSWLVLGLVSAAFLLSALSIGLLISTLSKVQMIASQVTLVVAFLPAYMLSGFLFDIASMPEPIQLLTFLMPARYFVQCLQTLFMAGNVWSLIGYNIVVMLVFAAFLFVITVKKTVKRLL
jgi:ABC-2 type transport system permease protein